MAKQFKPPVFLRALLLSIPLALAVAMLGPISPAHALLSGGGAQLPAAPIGQQGGAGSAPGPAAQQEGNHAASALSTAQAMPPMTPAKLLSKMHLFNQVQIAEGLLAERKATSQPVRNYATLLVRDHTKADGMVERTAKAMNIQLQEPRPQTPLGQQMMHQNVMMMRQVLWTTGKDFDRAYLQAESAEQQQATKMATQARQKLQNPQLQQMLGALLPILHQHVALAQKLSPSATHLADVQ